MTSIPFPDTLTLIPTYDCTAACENCCFGSHPGIRQRLPLERIHEHIDEAAALGTVTLVVFTGGECFSLGDDLTSAVARCTARGLPTRCVTNGYWARSEEAALARLAPLVEAGLCELNLSTGDAHQEYVPISCIVNAMQAATTLGLHAVVVVESQSERTFTADALRADPRWSELIASARSGRRAPFAFESPWMSTDPERPVPQPEHKLTDESSLHRRAGCESVLRTIVVTPDDRLGACCGLTREQIPELTVGSLAEHSMAELVDTMARDFVKIWVAVDGPDYILSWAARHDPTIRWEGRFAHHCDSCAFMYSDPAVRAVIREHWREVADDVLYRFAATTTGTAPAPPARA